MTKTTGQYWIALLAVPIAALCATFALAEDDPDKIAYDAVRHLGGFVDDRIVGVDFSGFNTGVSVTDADMSRLSPLLEKLKYLESLDLSSSDVSPAGMKYVARLKRLRRLRFAPAGFGDEGLQELAGLTRLETLEIGSDKMTGQGLIRLNDLKHLRSLWLSEISFSAQGLQELAGLQQLETLELLKCSIAELGLLQIAKLKNLKHLGLTRTKVTDVGLKNLKALTNLETLLLEDTGASAAAINDIQQALPRCHVTTER